MASSVSTSLGISQLSALNSVKIKQTNSVCSIKNKYSVVSPSGEEIMYAKEDSSVLGSMFSGKDRAFHMDVVDKQSKEVFSLRRPYTVGPDKMDVLMGGRLVAVVRKDLTFFKPVLYINNAKDSAVFKVKGPINHTGEANFEIFNVSDKKKVGCIEKMWGGIGKEMFTDKDNFRISFPADSDITYKAAIIGTCFLIDFLYYEN